MRVLMLVSEAPPIKSGIARVAGKLIDGLADRGIEVDVISANEIPRWTFKEFRFSSLAWHWPKIQRRLADYDILHVHGTVPTFSDTALLLGKLALRRAAPRAGIVYTHHSDIDIAGLDRPVGIYNALHYRLLHLADHIVASTPSYAMRLERHGGSGRVSAIPFGVDSFGFHVGGTKPDRFQVLFVGQLRPYKGVGVLLRAWKQVENADLHIVGSGHEEAHLKALAVELGLQSVFFHGSVTDKELAEFYAQAHTLVLPSTRKAEAFGLVLLEAMAAGCVPIASDLLGVTDVVGTSGYTFPVGDHEALARLLCDLRDHPQRREELTARARGRAIASAWDYTIDSYLGIYKQVHLGRLLEVSVGKTPPTAAALEKWLHDVAQVSGADRASLMVRTQDKQELGIAASIGIRPEVAAATRLRVGQRLAGFAAHTGRSFLVRPRGMPAMARLYRIDPRLTSSLILPLGQPEAPGGVLNLARGPERTPFTHADQRWLEQLAIQVGPLVDSYVLPPAVPLGAGVRDRRASVRFLGQARPSVPPVWDGAERAQPAASEVRLPTHEVA